MAWGSGSVMRDNFLGLTPAPLDARRIPNCGTNRERGTVEETTQQCQVLRYGGVSNVSHEQSAGIAPVFEMQHSLWN